MKTTQLLFSLLVLTSLQATAQNKFQVNLHLAPALGDFGKGTYDDYNGSINSSVPFSFAGTGTGFGIEYHLPIGKKGFHIYGALDMYWNRIKKIVRKEHILEHPDYLSIDQPDFYNIPFHLGPHYEYAFSEKVAIFVQAGVVGDLMLISKAGWTNQISNTYSTSHERKFSPSFAVGFSASAGVAIKSRYVIGLGYKGLGTHVFVRTGTNSDYFGINTFTDSVVKRVSLFDLMLAIRI